MANTMATCRGGDKSRVKEDHRLGSEWSEGQAQTWRTRATVWMGKDGKVEFQVVRDGHKVFEWSLPPEDAPVENVDKPLASQCCDLPSTQVCQHLYSCQLNPDKYCRVHSKTQESK